VFVCVCEKEREGERKLILHFGVNWELCQTQKCDSQVRSGGEVKKEYEKRIWYKIRNVMRILKRDFWVKMIKTEILRDSYRKFHDEPNGELTFDDRCRNRREKRF
jgi:hypothetical protein